MFFFCSVVGSALGKCQFVVDNKFNNKINTVDSDDNILDIICLLSSDP